MHRSIAQDDLKATVGFSEATIKLSIGFDSFYMTRAEALELLSQLEKAIHQTA